VPIANPRLWPDPDFTAVPPLVAELFDLSRARFREASIQFHEAAGRVSQIRTVADPFGVRVIVQAG